MITWVIYDIADDKTRAQVAKACKQSGLYRVQKSVFLGTLEHSDKDALAVRIRDLIDEEFDSVYLFPMSKDELKQTLLLGQAFDKKLVTDQVRALFF